MEKMFQGCLFFTNRRIGCGSEMLKRSERISSSSWEGGDRQSGWKKKIWHFLKQVCVGADGSADGTFPGRADERRESDPGGGESCVLTPKKIVREMTEEAVCAGRGGTLWKTVETVLFGICLPEIGSGKEEDKIRQNTFDDSKDCRGRLR